MAPIEHFREAAPELNLTATITQGRQSAADNPERNLPSHLDTMGRILIHTVFSTRAATPSR